MFSPMQAADALFLRAMLESSPDHIYFKDTKSRFLRINQALAKSFGLTNPAEALGKTDFDFHTADKAAVRFQDERSIMETGTPIIDKIEFQTLSDGKSTWVLTSKSPLCDEQGNLIGTFGISRDITLLKEMEDALWRERNLLRTVVDNVPDLIFAKDIDGRYTLSNQAHALFLGKSAPVEVIGKTLSDVLPPAAAELARTDDVKVWKTREPILNQVESPLPERWLSTSKIPIFNTKGEVTGLVAIARDITAERRARQELETTNAELQRSREELMRALEELRSVQLQLIEAEKMKLVGRLAAGVAHEVKNPLAIIRMGLEYLNGQSFVDPNIPVILEEIGSAVQRADSVVGELLDFSAPKQLNRVPSDLNRLMANALLLARGEIAARKIVVQEELTRELPLATLDAMKIEQVLVNVLTNGAHAMEQGGTLTVRTSTREVTGIGENISQSHFLPGDRLLIIEVMDSGPGVPEALIGKVFEPFFTTKPTGKGTGLGLTVAKTIVDLHGGTIEMKNRPEGGACVTIVFNADTH